MNPPRLVVPVADLRRHPGTRQPIERAMVAEGLAVGDAAIVDGSEVRLTGELESIADGVVLTGVVRAAWQGTCRRCLEPVDGVAEADVREVWESHPTEGDTWPLEGDQIDVGPLLRDVALLALPLAPLCREDCPGPAPDQFPTGTEADEAADGAPGEGAEGRPDADPPRDPRWAALDQLDLDD